jgi:hypothetical protein
MGNAITHLSSHRLNMVEYVFFIGRGAQEGETRARLCHNICYSVIQAWSRYRDGLQAGIPGFDSQQRQDFLSSPQRPDRV